MHSALAPNRSITGRSKVRVRDNQGHSHRGAGSSGRMSQIAPRAQISRFARERSSRSSLSFNARKEYSPPRDTLFCFDGAITVLDLVLWQSHRVRFAFQAKPSGKLAFRRRATEYCPIGKILDSNGSHLGAVFVFPSRRLGMESRFSVYFLRHNIKKQSEPYLLAQISK